MAVKVSTTNGDSLPNNAQGLLNALQLGLPSHVQEAEYDPKADWKEKRGNKFVTGKISYLMVMLGGDAPPKTTIKILHAVIQEFKDKLRYVNVCHSNGIVTIEVDDSLEKVEERLHNYTGEIHTLMYFYLR